jgi:hypothetical protein
MRPKSHPDIKVKCNDAVCTHHLVCCAYEPKNLQLCKQTERVTLKVLNRKQFCKKTARIKPVERKTNELEIPVLFVRFPSNCSCANITSTASKRAPSVARHLVCRNHRNNTCQSRTSTLQKQKIETNVTKSELHLNRKEKQASKKANRHKRGRRRRNLPGTNGGLSMCTSSHGMSARKGCACKTFKTIDQY